MAKWLAHLPFTSEAAGSSLSEYFLNATRTQSSCEKNKSQRSAESRGFSSGAPVSSHRESWQGGLGKRAHRNWHMLLWWPCPSCKAKIKIKINTWKIQVRRFERFEDLRWVLFFRLLNPSGSTTFWCYCHHLYAGTDSSSLYIYHLVIHLFPLLLYLGGHLVFYFGNFLH